MFNIKWKETEHTVKTALVVFAAEIVGTGILMFLGCMGGVSGFDGKETSSAQGAVVFGMTVCAIIQMLGHVSGAHLNPVVTVASWLWGTISLPIVIIYTIAQIIGAIAGFSILTAITPDKYLHFNETTKGFCMTAPVPELSSVQIFVGEFIATSMLVLLCCGCWDPRNESLRDSQGIKFGIYVAAISLAQGPFTGAAMNPARTLAPAIIWNQWDSHWIYWVAPLAAGVVVPILYKLFLFPGASENQTNYEVSEIRIDSFKGEQNKKQSTKE